MPYGNANVLFLTFCTILVLFMQAGFLCLEAGSVRSKNNINVAMKNLLDLILVALVYYLFSFSIQFDSLEILLQKAHPKSPGYPYLFMLFQCLFAVTAATIVSGAIAERCSIKGYMIIALLVAGVIYPVAGQWIWGGLVGTETGWLAGMGFIDFAGSTLVHTLGGSVALAAALVIGPRQGVFQQSYKVFHGQNQVLTVLGGLLIWLGWFGFNMGSLLYMGPLLPSVLINTFLGGCAGGLAATLWSHTFIRKFDVPAIVNGCLAGLVAITAGANMLIPETAMATGFIGALVCCGVTVLLQERRIDDVVGVIPVHLGAGIWGTLSISMLGDLELIGIDRSPLQQLGVQAIGVAVTITWSFGLSFVVLKLINKLTALRVSAEEEEIGLNITEHDAPAD
ncbi:MAG: ammonium transporter [Endozoicomonas sp.]